MKSNFVKSAPRFFGLITNSICAVTVLLFIMAALFPAPLQEQANQASTPNPVKSAWFLLWIQELVSWSRYMIYPVIAFGCLFILLPWLPSPGRSHYAEWFAADNKTVSVITVIMTILISGFTIVALFFRGSNWSLNF